MRKSLFVALALCCLASVAAAQTTPQERVIGSRAVEAAIWGMSAVNTDLMRQEMLTKTPGKVNQFIYWGRPLDSKNQTLTPNPDTLYFMAFYDTKAAGPMVLEVPPGDETGSLNGNIVTVWQSSLEDVGLLGIDHGQAASSSSFRRVTRMPSLTDTAFSARTPTAAMRLSAQTSRVAATRMWRHRSPMRSA